VIREDKGTMTLGEQETGGSPAGPFHGPTKLTGNVGWEGRDRYSINIL
jgi:hypothetical protein